MMNHSTHDIIVDSPGAAFQMAQCIGALSIEVGTGLKHSRGSVLKLVQERYGIKAKTKAKALEELKALYKEATGRDYGSRA